MQEEWLESRFLEGLFLSLCGHVPHQPDPIWQPFKCRLQKRPLSVRYFAHDTTARYHFGLPFTVVYVK